MITRDAKDRRNWVFIGDTTTAAMAMMGALLDASGAPRRPSRDGIGRWVHRRELRRAARLRRRLERALAGGTPIAEIAGQLGLSAGAVRRLADSTRSWR